MFQFYFRQHWMRLLWPFFRMILLSLLLAIITYISLFRLTVADAGLRHSMLFALMFFFTILQWEFLMRFYMYFLNVIIVTDKKVHKVKKTLFSVDDHQSLDIWTFQDIRKWQHGPLQSLFGYGTIVLESQDTELRLHFVPRISKIHTELMHLRERSRLQKEAVVRPS